jgi:dephospho-CoA kinase
VKQSVCVNLIKTVYRRKFAIWNKPLWYICAIIGAYVQSGTAYNLMCGLHFNNLYPLTLLDLQNYSARVTMTANSLVIGMTGNIATGKSTVLDYLAQLGAYIIDADKLAHQAMNPDGPAYQAVVGEFGSAILKPDNTIDRKALGKIVFTNADLLNKLEQIVHPAVFAMTLKLVGTAPSSVIILEAVKLLEAGPMFSQCDEVWVVTARPEVQLRRLIENRGMDEATARQRMGMQSPQAAKINQADRVIDNSGTLDELYAQLDTIWADLKDLYPRRLSNIYTQLNTGASSGSEMARS